MKLIIIIISILSFNGYSQNKQFTYDVNGLNPKYIVVSVDSLTQNNLFDNSFKWIKKSYKNPDEVIKSVIGNETIRFEGFKDNAICFGGGKRPNVCVGLTYLIDLEFKDGRYKFTPLSLSYLADGRTVNIGFDKFPVFNKKGEVKRVYNRVPGNIEDLFNEINEYLFLYLTKKRRLVKRIKK